MELTWQDVQLIVELYHHFEEEAEREEWEWSMDEDQSGIPYPYPTTKEDLYKQTLKAFENERIR